MSPLQIVILLYSVGALFYLAMSVEVARLAKDRGYPFWLWLAVCFLSLNPLLIVVILTGLPDARRIALREQELAELKALLLGASRPVSHANRYETNELSLGDQPTFERTKSHNGRSLGDEVTEG